MLPFPIFLFDHISNSRSAQLLCAASALSPILSSKYVLWPVSVRRIRNGNIGTYRDEQIRADPLILRPSIPILLPTLRNIPIRPMHDHAEEERRIEPRKGALEPRDQSPREGKEEVTSIVDLPRILVPPISQDRVSGLGWDGPGILDCSPR